MALAAARTDTRDLILDAVDRLMARYGFRKMTMDDVAREAGVSKRTIYLHFESKVDVGLSSIGRVVEGAQARLVELAQSGGPVGERLREMLVERVMRRVRAVADYHHSLDELFEAVRPAYLERRRRHFEKEREILAEVLAEGRALGEFHFDGAGQTANDLLLATNAFLPYSLSVRELGRPDEIERRLRHMVALLLRGLTNPKETQP